MDNTELKMKRLIDKTPPIGKTINVKSISFKIKLFLYKFFH